GIALGALIAWRTGSPKDFYLPGILLSLAYSVAGGVSVPARRPLVGWIWSVVADHGRTRWRDDPALRRIFGWLTVLWATIYLAKGARQAGVCGVRGRRTVPRQGRVRVESLLRRGAHRRPEGHHPRPDQDRAGLPAVRAAARRDGLGGTPAPAHRPTHRPVPALTPIAPIMNLRSLSAACR